MRSVLAKQYEKCSEREKDYNYTQAKHESYEV